MKYDERQLKAVEHGEGPCLVLAGPGAGKTAVITGRAVRLTKERGVSPENLLVITFTRAAAEEMKERFLSMTGSRETRVTFGTFHSVFFQILKEADTARSIGGILTEGEKLLLMEDVFREHYRDAEADPEYLRGLLSDISRARNTGEELKQNPAERVPVREAAELYESRKRKSGKIDFDDMLVFTLKLLSSDSRALGKWRERFQYIMVDEFQDINRVQYDILKLLASPRNNLFAVGDDDQSIYRFRGAGPGIMLAFPEEFPGAPVMLLSKNYRCRPEIVKASLSLISHNRDRYPKKLSAVSKERGNLEKCRFRNEAEEGEGIAGEVKSLLLSGVSAEQIAVLTRTNQGAAPVLGAFTRAGIPFYTRDRTENFYGHFILKPVFAMLNWTLGNRSRGNFLRFMNCPARYIRREELISESVDLGQLSESYLAPGQRFFMAERIRFLDYQLGLLKRLALPYAMVNYIRTYMEYDRYVKTLAEQKGMDAEALLSILDELLSSSRPFRTLEEWYAHIAEYTKKLRESGKTPDHRNLVTVSTLHHSKGLQYRAVFIPGVNEKVIPHEKSRTEEEIEEERRMLYVGMTRAVERLYLFSASERYGKKAEDSRFLAEIR